MSEEKPVWKLSEKEAKAFADAPFVLTKAELVQHGIFREEDFARGDFREEEIAGIEAGNNTPYAAERIFDSYYGAKGTAFTYAPSLPVAASAEPWNEIVFSRGKSAGLTSPATYYSFQVSRRLRYPDHGETANILSLSLEQDPSNADRLVVRFGQNYYFKPTRRAGVLKMVEEMYDSAYQLEEVRNIFNNIVEKRKEIAEKIAAVKATAGCERSENVLPPPAPQPPESKREEPKLEQPPAPAPDAPNPVPPPAPGTPAP
jgi:hypothetical protein